MAIEVESTLEHVGSFGKLRCTLDSTDEGDRLLRAQRRARGIAHPLAGERTSAALDTRRHADTLEDLWATFGSSVRITGRTSGCLAHMTDPEWPLAHPDRSVTGPGRSRHDTIEANASNYRERR